MHSKRFVEELSKYREVEYYTVPNRDHCDFDEETTKKYRNTVLSYVLKNA